MNNEKMSTSLNGGTIGTSVKRTSYGSVIDSILRNVQPDNFSERWLKKYKENNWLNIRRGLDKIILAKKYQIPTMYGILKINLIKRGGDILDYGIVSTRVITTVGAGFIIDGMQNIVEVENMKYHGIGEGNTAENVADTDLETELTTEYVADNTRATGTTAEGATGNIYSTVGTNEVDATVAIVEHGIFDNATVGSGVLFDRSVFAAINMISGDQLESTYEWTLATGG